MSQPEVSVDSGKSKRGPGAPEFRVFSHALRCQADGAAVTRRDQVS